MGTPKDMKLKWVRMEPIGENIFPHSWGIYPLRFKSCYDLVRIFFLSFAMLNPRLQHIPSMSRLYNFMLNQFPTVTRNSWTLPGKENIVGSLIKSPIDLVRVILSDKNLYKSPKITNNTIIYSWGDTEPTGRIPTINEINNLKNLFDLVDQELLKLRNSIGTIQNKLAKQKFNELLEKLNSIRRKSSKQLKSDIPGNIKELRDINMGIDEINTIRNIEIDKLNKKLLIQKNIQENLAKALEFDDDVDELNKTRVELSKSIPEVIMEEATVSPQQLPCIINDITYNYNNLVNMIKSNAGRTAINKYFSNKEVTEFKIRNRTQEQLCVIVTSLINDESKKLSKKIEQINEKIIDLDLENKSETDLAHYLRSQKISFLRQMVNINPIYFDNKGILFDEAIDIL